MLSKLLFLVLLGLLLFVLWQKKRMPQVKKEQTEQGIPKAKKMVQCPVCGVHFAEVDGVWVTGITYCSQACAEKAKAGEKGEN